MKTDVVIVGAGPSGLMLGHLLAQAGVDAVILERKSGEYVLSRIRAGVLEQGMMDIMTQLDLHKRMMAEGIPHDYVALTDREKLIKISVKELTGSSVMIYGQTELTKDLMDATDSRGVQVIYKGEEHRIDARFIAGCDGFHGPSRQAIPATAATQFERVYPFGWLGILSDVPPCAPHEVVYANHDNGFALASMRSNTRSRYYLQVDLDDKVENWSDDQVWDELKVRLGSEYAKNLATGPSLEKSIAPLRSFIFERMRYHSLFLAGDSAHIVPPTGAKGLNLAASDIAYLAPALISYFKNGETTGIENYEAKALARVWKSSRFAWYLTTITHNFPEGGEFDRKMQIAELDYISNSKAAQMSIAENYIGLPL
jgi:p-hydroxybenzoate 3-monooxygenase